MKERMRFMKLKLYFAQLIYSRDIHHGLLNRLNNFSMMFNHHQNRMAFDLISAFADSKKVSHKMRKDQAANDIFHKLSKMV